MEFRVTRTSSRISGSREVPPVEGATFRPYDLAADGYGEWVLEVADLSELMRLIEGWGEEVVLKAPNNPTHWKVPWGLEIYDDYRE